jgi:hypothetical protein
MTRWFQTSGVRHGKVGAHMGPLGPPPPLFVFANPEEKAASSAVTLAICI